MIEYCQFPCLIFPEEEKGIYCKQREVCALNQNIPPKVICVPKLKERIKRLESIIKKSDMHTYGLGGKLTVYGSSESVYTLQKMLAEIDGLKIAIERLTKKFNLIYKIIEDKSISEKEQIEKIRLAVK